MRWGTFEPKALFTNFPRLSNRRKKTKGKAKTLIQTGSVKISSFRKKDNQWIELTEAISHVGSLLFRKRSNTSMWSHFTYSKLLTKFQSQFSHCIQQFHLLYHPQLPNVNHLRPARVWFFSSCQSWQHKVHTIQYTHLKLRTHMIFKIFRFKVPNGFNSPKKKLNQLIHLDPKNLLTLWTC